ncbi:TonB-dependent hem/hemoglobin receptor [Shewanella piezotolerans WP3]|uniref:TonB-dependent hem/hemoglobin receptor n=1 Tax=Shewanella piezotolerans (strain WP3 / JCM 13877) TaxID=225849 RepID=B8CK54_SHEPW|nr:TonB-dependent receptor [Shewanella piezotolerans]ACJ27757.1 TonB-dependent hem/hemoglobin receptor [Shewanella piezotolerans WP3]
MLSRSIKLFSLSFLALSIQSHVYAQTEVSAMDSTSNTQTAKIDATNKVLGAPKVAAMEVIEVTGRAYRRGLKLAPPGTAVMTMKEVEEQQSTQFAELVDQLPGVNIDGGTRVGGERINVWGFGDEEDLNLYLDNAPLGFEQYRYGSFFVDPDLIKQVQVIKGAHDVRSGNGGFGGSMYVTSKSAEDFLDAGEHFGARLKGGYSDNNDEKRSLISVYGQFNRHLSAIVNYTYRDANDTTLGNGIWGDNVAEEGQPPELDTGDEAKLRYSGYRQNSLLAKIDFDYGDHLMSLSMTDYKDEGQKPWANRRGQMPTISDYNIKKYGDYETALFATTAHNTYKDTNYSLNYRYTPNNDWIDTQLVVSTSDNQRHWVRPDIAWEKMYVSVGNFGHESWLDYKRSFVDINNTSWFGDNSLLLGLQYLSSDRDSLVYNKTYEKKEAKNFGLYTPYYQPSGKQQTSSAYAEFNYRINDQLAVKPSIRYDYIRSEGKGNLAADYNDLSAGHDYSAVSHSGVSPRLGVHYELSQQTQFYFDYAYTLQAPVIDDIYTVQYAKASKAITSSRDLEAERLHAYKLGLTQLNSGLLADNDTLSTQLTLYYHKGENDVAKRSGVNSVEQAQGYNTNLEGYYNQGADLVVNYRYQNLFADLDASYITGKHDGSLKDSTGEDEYLADLAPTNIGLKLGYYLTNDLMFAWRGKWYDSKSEDEMPTESSFRTDQPTDAYFVQDLYIAFSGESGALDNWEAYLTVKNITNQYYKPYMGDGVAAAGRDIRVSVAYTF